MLSNQFKTFSINLNAQHVNGITHFDGKLVKNICTVIRYSRVSNEGDISYNRPVMFRIKFSGKR